MFKEGFMRIGDTEYTLYELRTNGFYRLDITEKGGEFQFDVDSVLYSCYGRTRRKQYGNASLYTNFSDTVSLLKKMRRPVLRETKWERDTFVLKEQKGEPGCRMVTELHNGEWYGEIYEFNGITIALKVSSAAFRIAIPPLNDWQYRYIIKKAYA
jgi:hypothetical protein